jgi:hypothetical protein
VRGRVKEGRRIRGKVVGKEGGKKVREKRPGNRGHMHALNDEPPASPHSAHLRKVKLSVLAVPAAPAPVRRRCRRRRLVSRGGRGPSCSLG